MTVAEMAMAAMVHKSSHLGGLDSAAAMRCILAAEWNVGLFRAIRGRNPRTHDSNFLRPARIGIADPQVRREGSSSKRAERDAECARRVRRNAASASVRFAEVRLCATPCEAGDG